MGVQEEVGNGMSALVDPERGKPAICAFGLPRRWSYPASLGRARTPASASTAISTSLKNGGGDGHGSERVVDGASRTLQRRSRRDDVPGGFLDPAEEDCSLVGLLGRSQALPVGKSVAAPCLAIVIRRFSAASCSESTRPAEDDGKAARRRPSPASLRPSRRALVRAGMVAMLGVSSLALASGEAARAAPIIAASLEAPIIAGGATPPGPQQWSSAASKQLLEAEVASGGFLHRRLAGQVEDEGIQPPGFHGLVRRARSDVGGDAAAGRPAGAAVPAAARLVTLPRANSAPPAVFAAAHPKIGTSSTSLLHYGKYSKLGGEHSGLAASVPPESSAADSESTEVIGPREVVDVVPRGAAPERAAGITMAARVGCGHHPPPWSGIAAPELMVRPPAPRGVDDLRSTPAAPAHQQQAREESTTRSEDSSVSPACSEVSGAVDDGSDDGVLLSRSLLQLASRMRAQQSSQSCGRAESSQSPTPARCLWQHRAGVGAPSRSGSTSFGRAVTAVSSGSSRTSRELPAVATRRSHVNVDSGAPRFRLLTDRLAGSDARRRRSSSPRPRPKLSRTTEPSPYGRL